MSKRSNVLILGYGEMGHAMEYLLSEQHELHIWEKWPKDGFQSVALDAVAPKADIVVFCLPVNPHREVVTQIAQLLKKDCLSLSIAKGLDEAGETAAQIFADVLAERQHYALLYGPMISEEIRAGCYAFAQLGCQDRGLYERVRDIFAGTRLYIEYCPDINGISWSVILKNVYAMIFGMADELGLGDNMRGYLAVTCLLELDQIVAKLGGHAGATYHLAGLGDLITTATSESSHHHELGRMLAKGETQGIEGEGVHTVNMVMKHKLFRAQDYPLFSLIHNIVIEPRDVHKNINDYLDRTFGRESLKLNN